MIRIKKLSIKFLALFVAIHIVFFIYGTLVEAPISFEKDISINIQKGSTAKDVVSLIKENNLIVSPSILLTTLYLTGNTNKIHPGEYLFGEKDSVFEVHNRITKGIFKVPVVTIRIQEGLHNRDIAKTVNNKFPHINETVFLSLTKDLEGKLYPDTYKFNYNASADEIVSTLNGRYDEVIEELRHLIDGSKFTLDEIIIIASIVEREAYITTDRRYIAGILINRLNEDIPLQVDVSFYYINGKNTFSLTTEDLREDHPYNTYTRRGLPPTPIGNPSRASILAVLNPINSDFYYFIADKKGETHYSVTYEEHLEKKARFKTQ